MLIEVGDECRDLNLLTSKFAHFESLLTDIVDNAELSFDAEESLAQIDVNLLSEASGHLEISMHNYEELNMIPTLITDSKTMVEEIKKKLPAVRASEAKQQFRRTLDGSFNLRMILDEVKDVSAALNRRIALQHDYQTKQIEVSKANQETRKLKEMELDNIKLRLIQMGKVLKEEITFIEPKIKERLREAALRYPESLLSFTCRKA